jgi:hypothetical protein
MVISDFYISQAVFELRYDPAFIMWDKAGSIANEVLKTLPGAKVTDANPSRILFQVNEKAVAAIELEKLSITCTRPKQDLHELTSLAVTLTELVDRYLKPQHLIRVSTRAIYCKDLENVEQGVPLTLKTGAIRLPERTVFEQKEQPKGVDFSIRWENDVVGTIVRFRTETTSVEFGTPDFPEIEPIKKERARLIFDVDRLTKTKIDAGTFRTTEWIKSFVHLVNRDSPQFLAQL